MHSGSIVQRKQYAEFAYRAVHVARKNRRTKPRIYVFRFRLTNHAHQNTMYPYTRMTVNKFPPPEAHMKYTIDQRNDAALRYTDDQDHSAFAESNKRVVRNRFRDLSGIKVFDFDCGSGEYADYFRSIGADTLGTGHSECNRCSGKTARCTTPLCILHV